VKYVAVRGNGYYSNVPTYVAAQNVNSYYPMSRTRYIAVRNDDVAYTPRYVAVSRQPAYVDTGMSYAVVRNAPHTKYVAVRDMDMDYGNYGYAPTQYDTGTRYVAVRNISSGYYERPAPYVAVRNANAGCGCAVSSLEDTETFSPRHVVVKHDYLAGQQEVVYPDTSYGNTAYVAVPSENFDRTNVSYDSYQPTSYVDTGRMNYIPANYDSDIDDQAILDTSDAAYVAADDIEDACLSPVALRASPIVVKTKAVGYVPVNRAAKMVSYVPVSNIEDIDTAPVSYVPVENIKYVPVEKMQDRTVSYVPASSFNYIDTAGTAACACPTSENSVITNTENIADTSAMVEDTDSESTVVVSDTLTVAGANGYRDGFKDGKHAAKHGNEYLPEGSGDFLKATKGYDDEIFADKEAYKEAYRDSYLKGYRAGFDSVIGSG